MASETTMAILYNILTDIRAIDVADFKCHAKLCNLKGH